jgi:hypothetical protein
MLAELSESDARGDIARIYSEVRELCAVPYVASLHRHLATRPGWLEWCWAVARPAFVSGEAQTAAWNAAASVEVAPMPMLSTSALRLMGVDGDALPSIRAVCESFIHVSPTNLLLVALVRGQLGRRDADGESTAAPTGWTPPEPLPELPAMVDTQAAQADVRNVLMQLSNDVAGNPFVPGFYRMLGHWPAYLAHAATLLGPRFSDPATVTACDAVVAAVDRAAEGVLAGLPPPTGSVPRPPEVEHEEVLEIMRRYRKTSPEMVVFGTLLRDALPQS